MELSLRRVVVRAFFLFVLVVCHSLAFAQDPHISADGWMNASDKAQFAKGRRVLSVKFRPGLLRRPAFFIDLPDQRVRVTRRQLIRAKGNSRTWVGSVEGFEDSEVVLYASRKHVSGSIRIGPKLYEVTADRGGEIVVFEVDRRALPLDQQVFPNPSGIPAQENPVAAQINADGSARIDLMVVYTRRSCDRYGRDVNGGCAGLEAKINAAVADANVAYRNSDISINLQLVHTEEVSFSENGDMGTSLSRLQVQGDGILEEVHPTRNQVGADIVLMVSEDTNYCGLAYVQSSKGTSFAHLAFGVVYSSCLSNQVLAHEIGHIQGSQHDRGSAGFAGVAPYAYGYRQCGRGGFTTVMAYYCQESVGTSYFSSPLIAMADGRVTGTATEDNARSIRETAAVVAAWRNGPSDDLYPPDAPLAVAVGTVSSSSLAVSWSFDADDANGFHIERAEPGAGFSRIASVPADTLTFVDSGLQPASYYYYKIQAYNDAGGSGYSDTAAGLTMPSDPVVTLPAPPSNLRASVDEAVTLTWDDNAKNENGFEIRRDDVLLTTLDANISSWTDPEVQPGSTYVYDVVSFNSAGSSDSVEVVVTIAEQPEPISLTLRYNIRFGWRVGAVWSGARGSSVDVYIDSVFVANTENDGNLVLRLPLMESGTVQVCEVQSKRCSDAVEFAF